MHPLRILTVITARGGSKTIPRKNLSIVGGKPLIAWTIEAAKASPSLARILVSTDDEEIGEIARRWGAEVPFIRPAELAGDTSPHIPVVQHAVRWVEAHEGGKPDGILLLQPTTPLRTSEDIEGAIRLMLEKGCDSVLSVCEAASHPYLTKRITKQGFIEDFSDTPEGYLARQALPPAYALNGALYLARRDVLMEEGTFQTGSTCAYIMPPERSLDIDTPWDLFLVDLILQHRNSHGPH
jgi:CMP-N,N'-diacetyllegionaminic acid synthase